MLKRTFGGIFMSLAEVIIGILLLVNPVGFTSGIIMAFGIVLVLMGIVSTIKYFRTDAKEAAVSQALAKGLVMLLAGGFCALHSHWFVETFPVLTLLYGVAVLITGITKLQWAVDLLRMKRGKWYWAAISAAVSVLCGLTIIFNPFSTTAVLWAFIGISLIVEAVLDMISSLLGRREKQEPAEPAEEE